MRMKKPRKKSKEEQKEGFEEDKLQKMTNLRESIDDIRGGNRIC